MHRSRRSTSPLTPFHVQNGLRLGVEIKPAERGRIPGVGSRRPIGSLRWRRVWIIVARIAPPSHEVEDSVLLAVNYEATLRPIGRPPDGEDRWQIAVGQLVYVVDVYCINDLLFVTRQKIEGVKVACLAVVLEHYAVHCSRRLVGEDPFIAGNVIRCNHAFR